MSTRPTFAEASKALLRNTVLDALHELLDEKDWAAVTMADVASISGVSRQTVYNEFGSRNGLAQAYALRLVDEFVTLVTGAIERNEHEVHRALQDGFGDFFRSAAEDPLIRSLLSGEAKPDLLKLITTDAAPLIASATVGLARTLSGSWLALPHADAERIGRAISRMALSYVAMPPEDDRDVSADLGAVMAPAIIAARQAAGVADT
ncbi:TetR/AcrR family transcriptional regulator [Gordonia insulae]|uniref:TetR/AcrR family transcriptional regulator n=1 Tax=Gordonia insulae TaxID=2420509 RepID=UPI000F5BE2D9|nr:TetR family transcriptional regulator [Gordonia insulae]